ncbi:collagen alpha-1(I) chain-like [Sarcophilus harrisii]|uniref:collagen alpha-1(I) chain-like n=1 Tax=Sarcophilus harrisii TaxID=9305 RepID=UPI001301C5F7|nr:collagen alpha-1(I) chain-like [Sarcophilus harrisii]
MGRLREPGDPSPRASRHFGPSCRRAESFEETPPTNQHLSGLPRQLRTNRSAATFPSPPPERLASPPTAVAWAAAGLDGFGKPRPQTLLQRPPRQLQSNRRSASRPRSASGLQARPPRSLWLCGRTAGPEARQRAALRPGSVGTGEGCAARAECLGGSPPWVEVVSRPGRRGGGGGGAGTGRRRARARALGRPGPVGRRRRRRRRQLGARGSTRTEHGRDGAWRRLRGLWHRVMEPSTASQGWGGLVGWVPVQCVRAPLPPRPSRAPRCPEPGRPRGRAARWTGMCVHVCIGACARVGAVGAGPQGAAPPGPSDPGGRGPRVPARRPDLRRSLRAPPRLARKLPQTPGEGARLPAAGAPVPAPPLRSERGDPETCPLRCGARAFARRTKALPAPTAVLQFDSFGRECQRMPALAWAPGVLQRDPGALLPAHPRGPGSGRRQTGVRAAGGGGEARETLTPGGGCTPGSPRGGDLGSVRGAKVRRAAPADGRSRGRWLGGQAGAGRPPQRGGSAEKDGGLAPGSPAGRAWGLCGRGGRCPATPADGLSGAPGRK